MVVAAFLVPLCATVSCPDRRCCNGVLSTTPADGAAGSSIVCRRYIRHRGLLKFEAVLVILWVAMSYSTGRIPALLVGIGGFKGEAGEALPPQIFLTLKFVVCIALKIIEIVAT